MTETKDQPDALRQWEQLATALKEAAEAAAEGTGTSDIAWMRLVDLQHEAVQQFPSVVAALIERTNPPAA